MQVVIVAGASGHMPARTGSRKALRARRLQVVIVAGASGRMPSSQVHAR
jgi:hypothetical protein